ncbi:MAG: tyrosine-protein phosphatase [Acidimicrobiia bacterium]
MSWLTRRQRDGGIDPVPLPAGIAGRLWLCGKHAIGPDHESLVAEVGGSATVVCLTERHEIDDRYPGYVTWLDDPSSPTRWFPIHDLHAPDPATMQRFGAELADRLRGGETLVVHCAAGMGRAGTTAVCVLLALGVPLDDAVDTVARARPGAGPESGVQRELVHEPADRLR